MKPPRFLPLLILAFVSSIFLPIRMVAVETGESNANRSPETALTEARQTWNQDTNQLVSSWTLARAAFDCAESAGTDEARARFAEQGIEAAQHAVALDPDSAPAHYYLALNLGQKASTKRLGALKLVDQMEAGFLTAARLDAAFDHAGSHRSLGMLYREAPGWPVSVGSRKKAKKHLARAIKVTPEYPGNQLELLRTRVDWKEWPAAREQLAVTRGTLKTARDTFTGEKWETAWEEWEAQLTRLETAIKEQEHSR